MELNESDALLVIDVQNDFCPNGNLAVADGDAVVGVINQLIPRFKHVILTQDWHPAGHSSFASSHPGKEPFSTTTMPYGQQTLWPDHCIQGSDGARFHSDLDIDPAALVIRKGMNPEIDSYSAFFENDHTTRTGLAGYLRDLRVNRVFCCGLAFDYCVRYSAVDARKESFTTLVVDDACRAIDLDGSDADTRIEFKNRNIALVDSVSLLG
jgi:nicotinamidase/pyrazinamidase